MHCCNIYNLDFSPLKSGSKWLVVWKPYVNAESDKAKYLEYITCNSYRNCMYNHCSLYYLDYSHSFIITQCCMIIMIQLLWLYQKQKQFFIKALNSSVLYGIIKKYIEFWKITEGRKCQRDNYVAIPCNWKN